MTTIDSMFANYLKTEDITKETTLTIKKVALEQIEREEGTANKPVLYFQEIPQALILNRVNANAITELLGTKQIEDWVGKKITLFKDESVMFQDQKVGGIRIRVANQGVVDKNVV